MLFSPFFIISDPREENLLTGVKEDPPSPSLFPVCKPGDVGGDFARPLARAGISSFDNPTALASSGRVFVFSESGNCAATLFPFAPPSSGSKSNDLLVALTTISFPFSSFFTRMPKIGLLAALLLLLLF